MTNGGGGTVRWPRLVEYPDGRPLWRWGYGAGLVWPFATLALGLLAGLAPRLLPVIRLDEIFGPVIVAGSAVLAVVIKDRRAMFCAGLCLGTVFSGIFVTVAWFALRALLGWLFSDFRWV